MPVKLSQFKSKPVLSGNLFVLADAFYLGKQVYETKTGNRNFYQMALNFVKVLKTPKSDGSKYSSWFRVLTIAGNKGSEFNRFLMAYSGEELIYDKNNLIPFDQFGQAIVNDVKTNTYNFRIEWNSNGKISTIGTISKLKTVLEPKQPDMKWSEKCINKYPQIMRGISAPTTVNTIDFKKIVPNDVKEYFKETVDKLDPIDDKKTLTPKEEREKYLRDNSPEALNEAEQFQNDFEEYKKREGLISEDDDSLNQAEA